jgi:hypothetical protein
VGRSQPLLPVPDFRRPGLLGFGDIAPHDQVIVAWLKVQKQTALFALLAFAGVRE